MKLNLRRTCIFVSLALVSLFSCKKSGPISPTPPPELDQAVAQQAEQQAPGSELVGSIYKGVAPKEDQGQKWGVPLEVGKCYWFSGVGDTATAEKLYLLLRDPKDDKVASESEEPPRVMMKHCPEVAGMFQIEGKVTEGYGHFAIGVYATDAPKAPPPAAEPAAPPEPPGEDLAKIIEEMAASSAAGATRVGELFTGSAAETDWYVQLEVDKCYWLIGAGVKDINELYLYLWDPAETRITANKSETNRVTVGHCPTKPGMYHFQAKVNSGSGEYKVGVYAKKK